MDTKKTTTNFRLRVRERRFEWCGITKATTPRNGRRLRRSPRNWCTARGLGVGLRQAERDAGCAPARRRMTGADQALERENRELRQANEILRKRRLFARRARPAGSSHDRLHRRSSRGARGRADLRGFADRRRLSGACGDAPRSREGLGEGRRDALREKSGASSTTISSLWRAQVWRQLLREGESVARCTVER